MGSSFPHCALAEEDPQGHDSLEELGQPASSPKEAPEEQMERQQGGSSEEGEQGQLEAGPELGDELGEAEEDSDLARYKKLQRTITDLQGLQVGTHPLSLIREAWLTLTTARTKQHLTFPALHTIPSTARHLPVTAQASAVASLPCPALPCLQIRTYISEMQRWVEALQEEVKRVQALIAERRQEVTTAQGKVRIRCLPSGGGIPVPFCLWGPVEGLI